MRETRAMELEIIVLLERDRQGLVAVSRRRARAARRETIGSGLGYYRYDVIA